jgi:hypothetical protein
MDWEAFKYKRKSGKDRNSAQAWAIYSVFFFLFICAELIWGFSGWGSMYGSTVTVDRSTEPERYWFFIIIQIFILGYVISLAYKKYINAKRYLKGRRNAL